MAREKRIPFEVSADPFYSESNVKALDESFKQYEQGLDRKKNHWRIRDYGKWVKWSLRKGMGRISVLAYTG